MNDVVGGRAGLCPDVLSSVRLLISITIAWSIWSSLLMNNQQCGGSGVVDKSRLRKALGGGGQGEGAIKNL